MSTTPIKGAPMATDMKPDGGTLRLTPLTPRRRLEVFRERAAGWARMDGETLKRVVPSPTNTCEFTSASHISRAKSEPSHNPVNQLRRLAMDIACRDRDALQLLETRVAEMFAQVRTTVPDEDQIGMLVAEAHRETADVQRVSVEALADGRVDPGEKGVLLEETDEAIADLRALRRYVSATADREEVLA